MEILDRIESSVAILSLKGNIVAQTIAEIKPFLEPHVENIELKGLILNCEEVDYIDSAGLGLLASVFRTLQRLEKKLALTNVNTRIMETFTLTNLNNIFIVTVDVSSALKAVQ